MSPDERGRDEKDRHEDDRDTAAPRDSVPDDQAAGVEPMAEVPGGPQVDVPAAQGHMPEDDD
jgi:hypothetical protein